jgi:hypothetical protein
MVGNHADNYSNFGKLEKRSFLYGTVVNQKGCLQTVDVLRTEGQFFDEGREDGLRQNGA